MQRVFFIFFTVFSFFVLMTSSARAAESIPAPTTALDLTVSPITISLETDPGASVSSQIKIHNNGVNPEYLKLMVGKFTADSTGEKPQLQDLKPEDEFGHWLNITKEPFVVNPDEWKTIPFTFSPSQNAAFSYFYTITVSRQVDVKPDDSGTVVVSGSPAVLVLATVHSPNAKRELQFVSL